MEVVVGRFPRLRLYVTRCCPPTSSRAAAVEEASENIKAVKSSGRSSRARPSGGRFSRVSAIQGWLMIAYGYGMGYGIFWRCHNTYITIMIKNLWLYGPVMISLWHFYGLKIAVVKVAFKRKSCGATANSAKNCPGSDPTSTRCQRAM